MPLARLALVGVVCLFGSALAQDKLGDAKTTAKISADAEKALKRMQVPAGCTAEVWAAEPLLANPVSFCFDEQGRIYVAETYRLHKGVTDNRGHMNWLDDELACRTVADRLDLYKKYKYNAAGPADRIRRLESSTGRGKPDRATIFADDFNRPEDGLGAGVLAWRGNVYYTCIPDLWLLKDPKGEGKATVKKSLGSGLGVHVSFIGHDAHGLKMGPDGRVYFSIGDRGLNIVTAEGRKLVEPDCGAVLRCNPDGSELELVHIGLRNPQELAFDKFGNLFTVDNNADGGDQARIVQIVEGGDSGWRIGYQYLPRLGMWNDESVWRPQNDSRGAWSLPTVANLSNGPSGLTYHPGVAQIPEKYQDHFFLCDFRGGSGGSGIHAFQLKPKGATFELGKRENFVWSILATDCDFGPDGGFYLSDWIEGWGLTGKGRIYRVADPAKANDAAVKETEKLIAEGMTQRSSAALVKFLSHADMRVRLEAQFTLAERKATEELNAVAHGDSNQLARLHAIWGLGQIGRGSFASNGKVGCRSRNAAADAKKAAALAGIVDLLSDRDDEVRANVVKVLGEGAVEFARPKLIAALKNASPRVTMYAALALAQVGKSDDVPALCDVLRANADADPYVRHGAVTALVAINDVPALEKAAVDSSPSVRLGALLALRRLERPEVARFLGDADPRLVLEAARAISDTPVPAGFSELAKLLDRPAPDPKLMPANLHGYLLRRALAARYRLGTAADAEAVARFASKTTAPESVRLEAMKLLQQWAKPSGRDPIVGVWRPVNPRPENIEIALADAVRVSLPKLMTAGDKVRTETAKLAAQYGIKEVGPALRAIVADSSKAASLRIETLRALESLKDTGLKDAAEQAMKDADGRLKHEARRILLANAKGYELARELSAVLDSASVAEKQGALELLGNAKDAFADRIIATWLERLMKKEVPAEIQLDVVEAANRRSKEKELAKLLAVYQSSQKKGDHLASYREAMVGGNAEEGRRLFFDKAELSCVRCHKAQGTGGEVGPDLTGLLKRGNREYILESIVDPNKQIAKGFETVVLVLTNGQVKSGILKSETTKEVRLVTPEGQTLIVPVDQIEERNRGPSAMPADLIQKMNRRELRDLVEFLAGL
jgi:quinoprotein glucose dehydrogenase